MLYRCLPNSKLVSVDIERFLKSDYMSFVYYVKSAPICLCDMCTLRCWCLARRHRACIHIYHSYFFPHSFASKFHFQESIDNPWGNAHTGGLLAQAVFVDGTGRVVQDGNRRFTVRSHTGPDQTLSISGQQGPARVVPAKDGHK